MSVAKDVLEVAGIAERLNDDERAVLLAIARRLVMGRRQYGALDLATDARDWTAEAHAEALDLAAYLAIKTLRRT